MTEATSPSVSSCSDMGRKIQCSLHQCTHLHTCELVFFGEIRCFKSKYIISVNRLDQWFSNFLLQVPPQKIFGFPSTTIMTNIKMQYKWLPTAPGVCSRCVCVCTLDGLNTEHKFQVCHFTFSSTIHSKKKKVKIKRVSFNPYKDIYYCQPLKM